MSAADEVRHVGFTGSRTEPSPEQIDWLRQQLAVLWLAGYRVLHHGDCTGADAAAHRVAHDLGYRIMVHPPENPKHRAFCDLTPVDYLLPERPYLTRNRDIVDACEFLLALPSGQEDNHSGTWYTIRYADDTGVPLAMLIRGTVPTQEVSL